MKIYIIIILDITLLARTIAQAQGTVYVSNIGQPSTGNYGVASDAWYAAFFQTGNDAGGYILNSVQLGINASSGDPNNFEVMIYSNKSPFGATPGTSLATLDGPINPSTFGTYSYTTAGNLILAADSTYYVVVTDGTPNANGSYEWSLAGANSYNPKGGWAGGSGYVFSSTDGLAWSGIPVEYPQFSITATPSPEPPGWALVLVGGWVLVYGRRALRRCEIF